MYRSKEYEVSSFQEDQSKSSPNSSKQEKMPSLESQSEGSSGGGKDIQFWIAVVLTQLVGVTCVGLSFYWMKLYGGYSWADADKQFNYHPVFMVLGLIFLYGDAIIVYRVLSFVPKWILKIAHAVLHVSAIAFSSIALVAVLENHRRTNKADFYSLHSWIGIATIGLFDLQYIGAFVAFLWPGIPLRWRSKIMPFHTFFGAGLFVMAIASALMGITEKLLWTKDYTSNKAIKEGTVGNVLGLLLIVFAFLVIFISSRSAYKRKPLPEELPQKTVN